MKSAAEAARQATERKATRPFREQVIHAKPEPAPQPARDPLALRSFSFQEKQA